MEIPMYLAMTAAEFHNAPALPPCTAWMACHFSCYGTGLSNLPNRLPENAMVIVNDRTPVMGHDPQYILEQLTQLQEKWNIRYFLLDFQRRDEALTAKIAELLAKQLPCPTGVTQWYAEGLSCPVFLPPPPLHIPLKKHLESWSGREIWIEAAITQQATTVTKEGSHTTPVSPSALDEPSFEDTDLHCRYRVELKDNAAVFHLQRNKDQLHNFLKDAEKLGVTLSVGLYQQLGI